MPTTATATNFSKTRVARGPGKLYISVALPATGSQVVLHTDGSIDSTLSPNAKHVGMTKAGAKCSYTVESDKREADEFRTPYFTASYLKDMVIEVDMLQVFEPDILALITPTAKKITGVSGVEGITLGGSVVGLSTCAALVFPSAADPTKFCVWMLYDAQNEGGADVTINSKEDGTLKLKLVGSTVPTRPEGDQVGQIWRQI